jgi:hypothetical protein
LAPGPRGDQEKIHEIMMSTHTTIPGPHSVSGESGEQVSWLKRTLDAVVAARQAEACRQVASFLANHSDARLKELGFTEPQIQEVRQHGRLPVSYWS